MPREKVGDFFGAPDAEMALLACLPMLLAAAHRVAPDGLELRAVGAADAHRLQRLLSSSYVASADERLRLDLPTSTLRWLLQTPGACAELNIGLCEVDSGELIAVVCATPSPLRVHGERCDAVEVGLLCVARRWQRRGLARLLLAELRERAAAHGVRCAIYTTATPRGPPLLVARAFHRPLRPRALARRGFWPGATAGDVAAATRLPAPPGGQLRLRPMGAADVERCHRLLLASASAAAIGAAPTLEQFAHRCCAAGRSAFSRPVSRASHSYVVDGTRGEGVVGFVSFVLLPLRTSGGASLVQAQLIGYALREEASEGESLETPGEQTPASSRDRRAARGAPLSHARLLGAALGRARRLGAHVFNALALGDCRPHVLSALGFEEGDVPTHVYIERGSLAADVSLRLGELFGGGLSASEVQWLPIGL